MNIRNMNLLVVGDSSVGKTCLCLSYAHNRFPTENTYVPSICESQTITAFAGDDIVQITLSDSSSGGAPVKQYEAANVIILCFSILDVRSFKNVPKWVEEIRDYTSAPIILVGTKVDLRNDEEVMQKLKKSNTSIEIISTDEAKALTRKLKIPTYIECSSFTGFQLKKVFDEAILTFLRHSGNKQPKKKRCVIC
jgi:small GTP-binding protein